MSIPAENPTPDQFAAMGLECTRKALDGLRRQLAGCQETNAALARDNAHLRELMAEMEHRYGATIDRNCRLEARVEELERHVEATASARVERHLSGAGGPFAPLRPEQRAMLAELGEALSLLSAVCRPESGGENLAGG